MSYKKFEIGQKKIALVAHDNRTGADFCYIKLPE
jgi:hypothetical protein